MNDVTNTNKSLTSQDCLDHNFKSMNIDNTNEIKNLTNNIKNSYSIIKSNTNLESKCIEKSNDKAKSQDSQDTQTYLMKLRAMNLMHSDSRTELECDLESKNNHLTSSETIAKNENIINTEKEFKMTDSNTMSQHEICKIKSDSTCNTNNNVHKDIFDNLDDFIDDCSNTPFE